MPTTAQPALRLAFGPAMPGWGSWEWLGADLATALGQAGGVSTFTDWSEPDADVVVVIKQPPPPQWVERCAGRATLIYLPVDLFGDAGEIAAAAPWLRRCARIVVHCQRLRPYFQPFAPVEYLDHHLKFAAPLRATPPASGNLLWVGVRSNLPPLVAWVNAHALPAPLDVLTNLERPEDTSPAALGFRSGRPVQIHHWSAERQRQMMATARAALDIKGEDFRSQNKPAAKALDFIASGLPLAMNAGTSPVEYLAGRGLAVPAPSDVERWFSREYWEQTVRLGTRLRAELTVEQMAQRLLAIVAAARGETARTPTTPTRVSAPAPPAPPVSQRPAPTKKSQSRRPAATRPVTPVKAPPAAALPVPLRLYGLLITKDDHAVLGDWCRDQLPLYDAVVCLDGSESNATARLASRFGERLIYRHERDFDIPHKTDHGLRRLVHQEIVRRFGFGHWVMCCHVDEYCYHDPRQIARRAEREGYDLVSWFSPHFYPHPEELPDWSRRRLLPLAERFRHYHWNRQGNGIPWVEDRLYRARDGVLWDEQTHGSVRPHGLKKPAPFHPIFRHFKVAVTDPAAYEREEQCAHYKHHWPSLADRTGLPYPVRTFADLFVRAIPDYACCAGFDGIFNQPWNIGDHYRVKEATAVPDDERRHRRAGDLAVAGEWAEARLILEELDRADATPGRGALVQNDLAALAAASGDAESARVGFRAALALDPDCCSARANLTALGPAIPIPAPAGPAPIKVAVLSLLFNWPSTGGGNVHTAELTQFLARAGYEVRHFHVRFDPWRIGQVAGTPFPSTGLEFAESEWSAVSVQQRFRAAVAEFDPDCVILTDSWNFKPLLAEAVRGYPYMLRMQALECLCPLNNVRLLPEANGQVRQCTRYQLATPDACTQCVQQRGHQSGSLHQAERELSGVGRPDYIEKLQRAFAEAEAVLVVNPLTEVMVSPFARAVHVVTAGMDPARFPWPPPVSPCSDGRTRLLFAGLVDEWMKGFHILREACARLWARRQDFELVVTGDAPAEPEPFARYVGWQSQAELPRRLWECDVLVMPTVAQEALGRTAVEALAAGKPVVASRLGGLPFTVTEGATGLLCAPGDATDLAAKLETLLNDASLRERLGLAGRQRFEAEYAWPVIIERHYRPLLRRRERARVAGAAY